MSGGNEGDFEMNPKSTAFGLVILIAASEFALADDIPNSCLASFNVKDQQLSANFNWILGANTNASMSCAAAELLREKLFVEGDSMLTEGDLNGSAANAQQDALTAYNEMENKIQQLPGDDTAGTLFAATGYLYSKYQWASCLLTVEAEGGTCWTATASFLAGTSKFFQKIYQNQANSLRKQELLTQLQQLKPTIVSVHPGHSDPGGARSRWIRTQTQLCRAVQQNCL
jgi:hypothetical protein